MVKITRPEHPLRTLELQGLGGLLTDTEDSLRDAPLEDEITLVGDLVVAATAHDGPLSQDEIDEALGLE
ncbi:hypothetical protein GCM10027446_12490 [Angustibacter peucedani]